MILGSQLCRLRNLSLAKPAEHTCTCTCTSGMMRAHGACERNAKKTIKSANTHNHEKALKFYMKNNMGKHVLLRHMFLFGYMEAHV